MVCPSAPEQQWRSVGFDWLSSGISLTGNQPQCNSLSDQWGVWEIGTVLMRFSILLLVKGYQWLKERVNSEEGRRQLAKIKELHLLADRLGCTAAQLAIGTITWHTDIQMLGLLYCCVTQLISLDLLFFKAEMFLGYKTINSKCLFTYFTHKIKVFCAKRTLSNRFSASLKCFLCGRLPLFNHFTPYQ